MLYWKGVINDPKSKTGRRRQQRGKNEKKRTQECRSLFKVSHLRCWLILFDWLCYLPSKGGMFYPKNIHAGTKDENRTFNTSWKPHRLSPSTCLCLNYLSFIVQVNVTFENTQNNSERHYRFLRTYCRGSANARSDEWITLKPRVIFAPRATREIDFKDIFPKQITFYYFHLLSSCARANSKKMPPLFNLLKILGRLAWMTKFGIRQNLALFPPSLFPHKKFPCGEGSIIRRGSWWFAKYQSRAQNFYDREFATCIAWNKVEEISKQRNEERWSEKCGNYILYSVAHVEAWKGLDASIKRHNLHFSLIFFLLIFCWVNTRLARAIRGPVSSKSRNAEKKHREKCPSHHSKK